MLVEVINLVKLILVMPATNAVSSALTNNQLNHLLILHIRKLLRDRLDLTRKLLTSSLKEQKQLKLLLLELIGTLLLFTIG